MKNLFLVRLIVVFLLASLAHIDIVNATYFHRTPKKVNKADRQEIDKKLAELDTLPLRKETILLSDNVYSYLYLDKNGKIRKYEYLFHIHDGSYESDSIFCYYDRDGKLLKLDYDEANTMEGEGGFFYVKNGLVVDYDVYGGIDDGNEGDKSGDLIIPSPTIGDSLKNSFYFNQPLSQYLDIDTLVNYLCPNIQERAGYSYKAISYYGHNWVDIRTPFKECDYLSRNWIKISHSTTPTYDKLYEIIRMPLKKYLLHYEYFEDTNESNVNCPQERKNIFYVYLDSLNRLRKYETMFKNDKQDYGMSCFFDEEGTLLYVIYYNGPERGYFYIEDSLLCSPTYIDEKYVECKWMLEDALKNLGILKFPLYYCLHVTMLPNLTGYYEYIEDDETIEDDKNKKFTLPPDVQPIPLQQPY